jgi:hypothetical protein
MSMSRGRLAPLGGVERPHRKERFARLIDTARPRSWRTFGPRRLRRQLCADRLATRGGPAMSELDWVRLHPAVADSPTGPGHHLDRFGLPMRSGALGGVSRVNDKPSSWHLSPVPPIECSGADVPHEWTRGREIRAMPAEECVINETPARSVLVQLRVSF